ncbi:PIG-L deacetylase family protein [Microtetraspora niveoalba]|uniref:PIG-L deacetylase family protein n=1 Tax=Microtetraspora niveoalba TaxID=46175 RepID=UPI00082E4B2D|nr:PIG-L family deacetylase [Microtetraspora niveoalba]
MLRTLVIAAHPDEPEMYAGGTAALLARAGHAVKFLTLTNGDAGHHELERVPLARRRAEEARRAADALGVVDYEIFDVHDGHLEPTVETRLRVLAALRSWRPDVVVALHGDGGGHPDNRAAGLLVEHAVAFATTRNIEVGVPRLERQPLCLLMVDYSTTTHRHDVVVDVDPVLDAKLDACLAHASQFLEYAPWQRGFLDRAPAPGDVPAGRAFVREHWARFLRAGEEMRPALARRYGAAEVGHAETFQLAGYGRQVDEDELRRLLPIFGDPSPAASGAGQG